MFGEGYKRNTRVVLAILGYSLSPWIKSGCRSVAFIKLRFQNRLVIEIKEPLHL